MNRILTSSLLGVVLAAVSFAPGARADDPDGSLLERARILFAPLPADASTPEHVLTPARVELGRLLFFETRVSSDGKQSCANCHQPMYYGTDALPTSVGNHGKVLPRNAPTVFNTAFQFAQHYGGNRASVEEQAVKALTSALAYGNADYAAAEARLRALPYRDLFARAFPDDAEPVTAQNWGIAIGAFERTLVSRAPFDRFLEGDSSAIGVEAKRGLGKFMSVGCAGCHSGPVVGGRMFQKFGLTADYWTLTGSTEKALLGGRDKGRFHDTKDEADAFFFKVQQLRNVARTPPYFHDGSVATLPEAVRIMAKLQLGRDLESADVDDIVAFLESLSGEVPGGFAAVPTLPVAGYRD